MRFVPHLRDEDKIGFEALKVKEKHFQKEEFTNGFHVLPQGSFDEHIYYIFKGQCRLLLSTRENDMAQVFPLAVRERSHWLVLDTLHKGQSFGEVSAVNKMASPYTVEVCSEKATLLKIHINTFMENFGGEEGEPMMTIRSKIIMRTNWLRMKKQFLVYMKQDKLLQLDYRDDKKFSLLQPSRQLLKEVPYSTQTTNMQQKVTAMSIVSGSAEEEKHRQKQERIEKLKRELMQPVNRDNLLKREKSVAVSLTQNNMASEIAIFRKKQSLVMDSI